ncbi:flagellar P-ring protein precursor FlgI [Idiomarina fontislapidosi]|uniref:Flagellar P-ring protein n=1 Tax=Idiomarina fontislapidosi TaxID=263723 RepID=A0A432XYL4_9GAMM|nr:flagellar basal body P-ring protein FlgI [Idiomarina fontislapidosi]PYE32772.1 flagellar P-ring protein precursor FlgI [Idiomarina fontislapidosi]RUO53787.1 flagellar biosynthesis protein FlgI [Idiomarina fontislapidosi]
MKQVKVGLLIIAIISQLLAPAYASRIKDIASVAGIRSNQLIGYGLVVGLPGTGEQTPFTDQTFRTMLGNFGINVPQNERPKINNVAAVAVHAEIPAFAKPGQTLDVTVSSVGSADSLTGGTLLQTFLKGANGEVYAVAQGSLIVGGLGAEGNDGSKIVINTPTVGRIPGGAIVEREIPTAFAQGDYFTFNLHDSDFTTAKRVANTINGLVGEGMAQAIDATSIRVKAPRELSQRVSYMSTLENLEVEPAMSAAKIIINARTGTIVVGQNVELRPAAVAHGNMQVTISENVQVDQPNPFGEGETVVTPQSIVDVQQDDARMFVFEPGTTLNDLVRAVNQIGAAPGDIIAVLEALKHAGAISGELIVI